MSAGRLALAAALLGLAAPALAQKQISWDEVAVQARLDADGRLHVQERQAIVLDGDWNGAERRFRLGPDQSLALDSIARLDPRGGAPHALERGALEKVDHYDWVTPTTLRWRSRRVSDPPFKHTRLDYLLAFTYDNVLQHDGRGYLLDHDFALPEGRGVVRAFRLDLVLDPVWQAREPVPTGLVVKGMLPGQGRVVRLHLAYQGRGLPPGVSLAGPAVRWTARALLLLVPAFLLLRLVRAERGTGRLDPLPALDRAWFEKNVAPHRPEVIGAAWDGLVGAPEVAAVLARLEAEGKVKSRVLPGRSGGAADLELTLLVPRPEFKDYERSLVDALFVDGDTIDTWKLGLYYKETGFQPEKLIEGDLAFLARELSPPDDARRPSQFPSLALLLGGAALVALSAPASADVPRYLITGSSLLVVFLLGLGTAYVWRNSLGVRLAAAYFLVPVSILSLGTLALTFVGGWGGHLSLGLLGVALLALAGANTVLDFARTRLGPRSLALRRHLTAARLWMAQELRRPRPDLDDAWFAYLVAFGLDQEAQRWFGSYAGQTSGGDGSYSSSSPSSSSAPAGGGWSGGGGRFGGAGASASWSVAASGLAAGVASPASSSDGSGSSSGGGSSGGSSGGGGGGGW